VIYFDTSYLAKCYLTDHGYIEVRQLAGSQSSIMCCEFGRIELEASFHRKFRERHMTRSQYDAVQRQFDLDDRKGLFGWLPVTSELLKRAGRQFRHLSSSIFLRSGDVLHLACAMENSFKEIHSSDKHLLTTAQFFGLRGINVIQS